MSTFHIKSSLRKAGLWHRASGNIRRIKALLMSWIISCRLLPRPSSFLSWPGGWLYLSFLSFLLFFSSFCVAQQGEGDTCERLVAHLSSPSALPALSPSDLWTTRGPDQNTTLPTNNVVYSWWDKTRRGWMKAFGFSDACVKSNICPRCFPLCLISSLLCHTAPHSKQDGVTTVTHHVLFNANGLIAVNPPLVSLPLYQVHVSVKEQRCWSCLTVCVSVKSSVTTFLTQSQLWVLITLTSLLSESTTWCHLPLVIHFCKVKICHWGKNDLKIRLYV